MPDRETGRARAATLLVRPFQQFVQLEAAASIVLLMCAVVAMIWANAPFAHTYHALWETHLAVDLGGARLDLSLHHWINDGLMAVFFFVIGLEIKREVLVGELSTVRKAALPMAGALGGMVVPALIYTALNAGTEASRGWGIPVATDIAFALGVLALLGRRAPLSLKVFLTALAIVDDMGAVLVIALFYTAEVSLIALAIGGLMLAAMFAANALGVRHPLPYLLLGILLWGAILASGVHATVAGVLGALAIPARSRIDAGEFARRARGYLREFEEDLKPGKARPTQDQSDAVISLERAGEALVTPLLRLEHGLHPWVAWVIMPVFALANAGVALDASIVETLASPLTLGVILGLFFGKQIGVMLFAWAAVRLRIADLPSGASWRQLYGVAMLCGIGFTMSLFIANLAFPAAAMLDSAKTGILIASLLAGVAGWLTLRSTESGSGSV